jgi:hypothetical protein
MRRRNRVYIFTVLVSIGLPCAVSRLRGAELAAPWSLTVHPARKTILAGEEAKYWVGVHNGSQSSRVLCVRDAAYQLEDANGRNRGGSLGNWWTHACEADGEKHLLLVGETYFFIASVVMPSDLLGAARLHVSARLNITCLAESHPCEDVAVDARGLREIQIERPEAAPQ